MSSNCEHPTFFFHWLFRSPRDVPWQFDKLTGVRDILAYQGSRSCQQSDFSVLVALIGLSFLLGPTADTIMNCFPKLSPRSKASAEARPEQLPILTPYPLPSPSLLVLLTALFPHFNSSPDSHKFGMVLSLEFRFAETRCAGLRKPCSLVRWLKES